MNKKKLRKNKKIARLKKEVTAKLNNQHTTFPSDKSIPGKQAFQIPSFDRVSYLTQGYSQDDLAKIEPLREETMAVFNISKNLSSNEFNAILAGDYEYFNKGNYQEESKSFFLKLIHLIFPKPTIEFSGKKKPTFVDTVHNAYNYANTLARQNWSQEIDCEKNCSWCCSLQVALSIPEVLVLRKYLTENLSLDEFNDLRIKLSEANDLIKNVTETERNKSGMFCPLLVDNKCSVYQVRPLTCRGYNSTSRSACEKKFDDYENTKVSYAFAYKEFIFMVYYGLCEGANKSGLQGGPVELISALNFALQTEDIESRWLSGEEIFPSQVFISFG